MKKQTKNIIGWLGISILIIVIGVTAGSMIYIYSNLKKQNELFISGVTVENISVGGLTFNQAKEKLQKELIAVQANQMLILYKDDKTVNIKLNELKPYYNLENVLEEAFRVGKDGNILERYKIAKKGVSNGFFALEPTYTKEDIIETVTKYKEHFFVPPVDATIKRQNRQFRTTKEVAGSQLNVSQTADLVFQALQQKDVRKQAIKIEVVTEIALPKYTVNSFNDVRTPISSFYTAFNNADPGRNANLQVATAKINKVLAPGEVFSLSKQLEPINASSGYKASKVIVNGKLEDGIGGGVCQVASTLYNAVLLTNLDVTLRQNHSLPVAYVPLGRDATYATGLIDFRFKNNSDKFMFVESYCENNKVFVNIFGNNSLKPAYDEIKFLSETVEVIPPPPTKFVNDPEMEMGKQVQELRPLEGKKVRLYKLYYSGGELVKKEYIDQSYYKARGEVIKVGIKEAVPVMKTEVTPLPSPSPTVTPIPTATPSTKETSEDESDAGQDTTLINLYEEPAEEPAQ